MSTEIDKIIGVDLDFSFVTLYLCKILEIVLHKDRNLVKILLASVRNAIVVATRPSNVGPVVRDHSRNVLYGETYFCFKASVGKMLERWEKWIVYAPGIV